MRMFITSKNKYLSNDMKIFGTCSIPLIKEKNKTKKKQAKMLTKMWKETDFPNFLLMIKKQNLPLFAIFLSCSKK